MIHSLLHRAIASFLTIILLAGTINNAVIMGEFLVNQDIIAKTLCVQKEAQVDCFGKCQLREALNETTSDINSNEPYQNNERTIALEIVVFIESIPPIDISNNELIDPQLILNRNSSEIPSLYYDIDTPPPVLG